MVQGVDLSVEELAKVRNRSGFPWVHVRPRECCRVVRLVVQGVDLSVEELAKVRNRSGFPWVHGAMHGMKMGDPVVGDQEGKHQIHHWSLREWLESWEFIDGPKMAEQNLNGSSAAAC